MTARAPLIPVILSGGSGTRLWPLSVADRPKQFLSLVGHETLFQETLRRLETESRALFVRIHEAHDAVLGARQQAVDRLLRRRAVLHADAAIGADAGAILPGPFISPRCSRRARQAP